MKLAIAQKWLLANPKATIGDLWKLLVGANDGLQDLRWFLDGNPSEYGDDYQRIADDLENMEPEISGEIDSLLADDGDLRKLMGKHGPQAVIADIPD